MKPDDIARLLHEKNNFLLLIHHSPDGDAIASSLGLNLALKSLDKSVDIVCADPIPIQFQFLPTVTMIQHDFLLGDYDAIVTLDCGDSKRTGFKSRLKSLVEQKSIPIINIDHHPKNDLHNLATYNFVDYSAPSTSYLVHKIIRSLNVPVNHKIATCLLTGLYTDTGGFKHPNTTAESLNFASQMLTQGARLKDITLHIAQASTVSRLKLWGIALSRIQKHDHFNIISTYITHADMLLTSATETDVAGIAALLGTIPATLAVLVIQQSDQTVQVRMRTKRRDINVGHLAAFLGGGGQKKSAGFAIKNHLVTLLKKKAPMVPQSSGR